MHVCVCVCVGSYTHAYKSSCLVWARVLRLPSAAYIHIRKQTCMPTKAQIHVFNSLSQCLQACVYVNACVYAWVHATQHNHSCCILHARRKPVALSSSIVTILSCSSSDLSTQWTPSPACTWPGQHAWSDTKTNIHVFMGDVTKHVPHVQALVTVTGMVTVCMCMMKGQI